MKNTRKGFTITELVIVIAVIAILAAVLIPTFSNLIKKANMTFATALRSILRQDPDVIRREAIENGMTPLWNACRDLVLNGTTSLQELMSLNIE